MIEASEAGAQAGKTRRPATRPPIPDALADVALIDGPTAAAAGAVSLSTWHDEVRAGRAPQPVIREPRCTRWRLVDVHAYWAERAARGIDAQASERVQAQAATASRAAQAKRFAARLRDPEVRARIAAALRGIDE